MTRCLAGSAAREQGDERDAVCYPELAAQFGASAGRFDQPAEWMSYICCVDAVPREELRLEWEDAQQSIEGAAHHWQAAFAPCPYLGRNKIEHGNAELLEAARYTQVEIGAVGEDGKFGALGFGCVDQFTEFAVNPGNMCDYFDQANHRKTVGVHDRPNTGVLHARAGASEEVEIGPAAAQGVDER